MPFSTAPQHRHAVTVWAGGKIAERRNGGTFFEDFVPDESERTVPAIDLVGHDSLGAICLEHTLVEAYEGQTLDNKRAREVSALLAKRLARGLDPPGAYTLGLNLGDLAGLRRKDVRTTVEAVEVWARRQALPIPETPPLTQPNHVISDPGDAPIRATLFRMRCPPEDDGSVRLAFLRDPTIEDRRQSRIRKALTDKLPKLEATRTGNSTTALVIETSDYILSNTAEVSRVFYTTSKAVGILLPDIVIVVDTSAGDGAWTDATVKFGTWWSEAALAQTSPPFRLPLG
jgi:hypothetical protein